MKREFFGGKVILHGGDCLDVMDRLAENSMDGSVCDPPYHLASIVKRFGKAGAAGAKDYSGERPNATGAFARSSRGFMGKEWDGGDIAFRPETWAKVLRVLKPGAHLVAFAAPKNVGHLQVAIEAAGFETRDCLLDLIDLDPMLSRFVGSLDDEQRGAFFRLLDEADAGGLLAWVFGSGFPKSHNIALDFERELCEAAERNGRTVWVYKSDGEVMARVAPFRSAEANEWAAAGTALKPAFEPIVLARKPIEPGLTIAENCRKWGTGALNIDGCRIAAPEGSVVRLAHGETGSKRGYDGGLKGGHRIEPQTLGRFPANVLTDGSPAAVAAFPDTQSGQLLTHHRRSGGGLADSGTFAIRDSTGECADFGGDAGSAARFFYSAKADDDDRLGSKHPTVKPVDLMQYLVRLVTRPGQTVLDLFAGTGTTGEAAWREGRRAVLIEREPEYQADIARRMALCLAGPEERARETIKQKLKDKPVDAGPLFGGEVK